MTAISALLAAMPDPAAVDEHWRRICREMVRHTAAAEYERGLLDGYLLAIADLKAFQHGEVRDAQIERRRWHLCCRAAAWRDTGRVARIARTGRGRRSGSLLTASRPPRRWQRVRRPRGEPLGLGPGPGWVHLGGPPVHHHACTAPCYAYQPGWYTLAEAVVVIATLPGDYAALLEELRTRAGAAASLKAAA